MYIISCGTHDYFNCQINHKDYASYHNIDYVFYKNKDYQNPFFMKIDAILDAFAYTELVFYLDYDAFFVDKNWDCRSIFVDNKESFVVTASPSKRQNLPRFNSGVMAIRKNRYTIDMLQKSKNILDKELKKVWNKHRYGDLDGNDQPRLIYLSDILLGNNIKIIPFPGFNGRRKQFAFDTPIVHFVSKNKETNIQKFQKRTGINLYDLD